MPAAPIELPERLNMVEWFLDARLAEGLGDKTAIYYGEREVSYRELVADSCRVTNLLRALGLRIEDRVQLLLLDTPEFAAAYFGILRAGCVAVPTNTWLLDKDYAYYLEYARPRAVIVDAEVYPQLAGVWREAPYPPIVIVVDRSGAPAPAGTVDWNLELARQSPEARTEATWRDDFATWLSSSGSTGRPKCVVHMHHDFVWNTIAYAQRTLGLTRDDITMSAPKLFFGYALGSNLLFPLSVGGSCVLLPERTPAEQYYALIERYKVTQMVAVPTTIAKMVEHAELAARHDLRSLHSLVSAGEALPARIYRAWKQATGVEIYDGIGSAEMFHVYITGRPGDVKEGSLGKLVEGYSYRLIDDAGREVPPGEIGTLVITGPSAGQGYWRMRDQSRATFWGDSVRGSDKFHVDAEGYFWFCGRGDDMLKCSGVYVSPVEVENCLLGHPAVHEAGVVGYRDAAGLEKAVAYVELASGHVASEALAAEVLAHARANIAAFKAPRRVVFVASLPRTETGKIKRGELRTLAVGLT
ncbi:MAG: benzoate-CoA ligase family protein [Myxococcales bacterium]|nr:benzoate-CoA ligase family protein [Myxococcales bacterium]